MLVIIPRRLQYSIISVDFRAIIFNKKIKEKRKKTHRFNVIQQIVYVHGNRKEDFHYISN